MIITIAKLINQIMKLLIIFCILNSISQNFIKADEILYEDIKKSELDHLPPTLKGEVKIWNTEIRQISYLHYRSPGLDDPANLAFRTETILIDVYVPTNECKLTKNLNESLKVLGSKTNDPEKLQFAQTKVYIIEDSEKNCWLVHCYVGFNYALFQSLQALRFKEGEAVYSVLIDYDFFRANGELNIEVIK